MMLILLLAGVFIPLFPLSIVHNLIFSRLRNAVVRSALLLVWPQIGITLLAYAKLPVPEILVAWAWGSAGLYALRLLTVRDLGLWAATLASSTLALIWGLAETGADETTLRLFALWFSLPAALLALLTGSLQRRFGAAYAGLNGGLACSHPRLAGVLVLVVLAAIATPIFPGFFAVLALLQALDWRAAIGALTIWLVWSWAAALLFQGFVFGAPRPAARGDLGSGVTLAYGATLVLFAAAGLYLAGGQV
jgi:hypothetical protein